MNDDEVIDAAKIEPKNTVLDLLRAFQDAGFITLTEKNCPKNSKIKYRFQLDVLRDAKITLRKTSKIALKCLLDPSGDKLVIQLVGTKAQIVKRFNKVGDDEPKILKAIKKAIERSESPDIKLGKKVFCDEYKIKNLEDFLDKTFASLGCSELIKLFFNAKSTEIKYQKTLTFEKLRNENIRRISVNGTSYICNFDEKRWIVWKMQERKKWLDTIKEAEKDFNASDE